MQNWKKGCVFGHNDKFWKGNDRQIKKNACKNAYLGSIFIPEKYVIRVLFLSPWTSLIPPLAIWVAPPASHFAWSHHICSFFFNDQLSQFFIYLFLFILLIYLFVFNCLFIFPLQQTPENGHRILHPQGALRSWSHIQARSQDRFWGGAGPQKSGPFGPKKWTFLNLTPLTLLQKPHFWPTLWLKVDLLADLGGASHPPHPPGYRPAHISLITKGSIGSP